jgi:hypothetical protein
MIPALERAVRVSAHQHYREQRADVRHGRQDSDPEAALHAEALNDGRQPESDRYDRAGGAEVDEGQEPQTWKPDGLAESVFARSGQLLISFQIG